MTRLVTQRSKDSTNTLAILLEPRWTRFAKKANSKRLWAKSNLKKIQNQSPVTQIHLWILVESKLYLRADFSDLGLLNHVPIIPNKSYQNSSLGRILLKMLNLRSRLSDINFNRRSLSFQKGKNFQQFLIIKFMFHLHMLNRLQNCFRSMQ